MILLSFDIEEFDVPLEHGIQLPIEEQIRISAEGTYTILNCLQRHRIRATFFCTVRFAQAAPEVMQRIVAEGHEVASHGYYHSQFEEADLLRSRQALEALTGQPVGGYRQPRMMPVAETAVSRAGYRYNSSLHPTCIPGRYMHLSAPRTAFMQSGVWQLPASVTPRLRLPLFWLSCHHLPPRLYRWLCRRTLRHDGYLVIYFHPWEFYPLAEHPEWKLPFVIRNNSGRALLERLEAWIAYFEQQHVRFDTCSAFIETLEKRPHNTVTPR